MSRTVTSHHATRTRSFTCSGDDASFSSTLRNVFHYFCYCNDSKIKLSKWLSFFLFMDYEYEIDSIPSSPTWSGPFKMWQFCFKVLVVFLDSRRDRTTNFNDSTHTFVMPLNRSELWLRGSDAHLSDHFHWLHLFTRSGTTVMEPSIIRPSVVHTDPTQDGSGNNRIHCQWLRVMTFCDSLMVKLSSLTGWLCNSSESELHHVMSKTLWRKEWNRTSEHMWKPGGSLRVHLRSVFGN